MAETLLENSTGLERKRKKIGLRRQTRMTMSVIGMDGDILAISYEGSQEYPCWLQNDYK